MYDISKYIYLYNCIMLLIGGSVACMGFSSGGTHAAEPKPPMRAVLVGLDRVSPEFLAQKKSNRNQHDRCAARRKVKATMGTDGKSHR